MPIEGRVRWFGSGEPGRFTAEIDVGLGAAVMRSECVPGLEIDPQLFGRNSDGTPVTCPQAEVYGAEGFTPSYTPNVVRTAGVLSISARLPIVEPLGLRFGVRDWVHPVRVFRPGTNEPTQRFTDEIRHVLLAELGLSVSL